MYKQAVQKARNIWYVKVKATGKLVKEHSNLYRYEEDGQTVEFVANFFSPAVGGYIVLIEGDAPIYLNEAEFNRAYMEQQDGKQVSHG